MEINVLKYEPVCCSHRLLVQIFKATRNILSSVIAKTFVRMRLINCAQGLLTE